VVAHDAPLAEAHHRLDQVRRDGAAHAKAFLGDGWVAGSRRGSGGGGAGSGAGLSAGRFSGSTTIVFEGPWRLTPPG
jgi:hypothetical protein